MTPFSDSSDLTDILGYHLYLPLHLPCRSRPSLHVPHLKFFRLSTPSIPTLAAEAPSHSQDPLRLSSLVTREHCSSGSRARRSCQTNGMHRALEGNPTLSNPHSVAISKFPSHSSWSEKTVLNSKSDPWCPTFAKGVPIPLTMSWLI